MHRRKKLPIQKLPPSQTTPSTSSLNSEDVGDEEDAGEKFERELRWCIEQLSASLSKTDSKKKNHAEHLRALQTLQSAKAPLAKKRQVMSLTLGNYREKMREEKAKFVAESTQKARLQPQCSPETKSVFLRKVAVPNRDCTSDASASITEFKFNFSVDPEDS
uniref:Uncharacterized protein n=1 Tax=Amblyomma triste TaxID=251400 RepID=A0A023GIF5_AMBTT